MLLVTCKPGLRPVNSKWISTFACFAAFLLILTVSCGNRESVHVSRRFFRMDTVVDVTLATSSKTKRLDSTWSSIDSLLTDWGRRYSQTHSASEVLALNRDTADTVKLSSTLAELIDIGIRYGDTLGGVFDLTILPVKEIWGFGEDDSVLTIPDEEELRRALDRVDFTRLHVIENGEKLLYRSSEDVVVDVGGVAKGYALVELRRLLENLEYHDFLISAGGDILASGMRNDGRPWRVGVQHPRSREQLLAAFPLDSGAVVTSGDYERFYMHEGIRYHHIFDPRTGQSCRTNQSLTVRADNALLADVLSTGLFCLPADSVLAFIHARDNLDCIVVDSSGEVHVSTRWREQVELF